MNGTVYFSGAPVACTSGERILRCAGFAQDSARPFARKAGTGAWPQCGHLPRVDFEDTGVAADQPLQVEDRVVRFQTSEVDSAVKSATNVVLDQAAKKHRKAQESCISLAS